MGVLWLKWPTHQSCHQGLPMLKVQSLKPACHLNSHQQLLMLDVSSHQWVCHLNFHQHLLMQDVSSQPARSCRSMLDVLRSALRSACCQS